MAYSQEPISEKKSERSIRRHGSNTPFRHHTVIQEYIEGLLDRHGYKDFVELGVTVERVEKVVNGSWKVTLRRSGAKRDYWWVEEFDAVVVASGHYTVPFVPYIEGLEEFDRAYPGSVEHSKGYRGPEKYRGKVCYATDFSSPDANTNLSAESRCRWCVRFGNGYCSRPHRRCAAPDQRLGAREVAPLFRFDSI